MFWGLIMEPKRRYTQTVKRPFHVSMAALDIFASNNEPCQVMLNFEDRHYLLCTLQKGKDVQCVLDLNFEAGNKVVFATNGDSNVHLTGYLVEDLEDYAEEQDEDEEEEEVEDDVVIGGAKRKSKLQNESPMKKKSKTELLLDAVDDYDSNDDESFSLSKLGEDSEEESDSSSGSENTDEDDDEDEEDEVSSIDDDDEEVSSLSDDEKEVKTNGVAPKRKVREAQKKAYLAIKSQSPKEEKTPSKQDKSPKAEKVKTPKGEKTPKGNKGEANQKNGSAVKTPKQQAGSPQKRVLEGGIIVQDIVVGDGQTAKPGKFAEVYYEGRLKQNNKVFDKLRQGAGFKFRLGKQEVIKGWDVGVAGMKVGGKRRITCPPNMAYGAKGSPPQIPPNSTLVFEVELKNTK